MPLFAQDGMDTHTVVGTNFKYSAMRVDDSRLGSFEYTLVGLTVDKSSSVSDFRGELEKCVKAAVASCKYSPRGDSLMLRYLLFNEKLEEGHGYRPLAECDEDKYIGSVNTGGMTACFDACVSQLGAMQDYAEALVKSDYETNGILFVITDGMDNRSTFEATAVASKMAEIRRSEYLESLLAILIGVNVKDTEVKRYLRKLEKDGGFDQYVEIENADAKTLARLSDFVSKSISAQSQALKSGGASQALNF